MSFEFLGAYKVFPYLLATALLGLGALGLSRIKEAFTEEEYIRHKSWWLLSGVIIYVFAFVVSVAGSIHNMYFRMTSSEMQEQEINEVFRDLSQVNANAGAIVKRSVDDFNNLIETRLTATIKEINNWDVPGAGRVFQERKKELESALGGVSLDFVSGKDANTRPTAYAIGEFAKSVRELKDRMIATKQASGKETTDQVASAEFKQLLSNLSSFKNDYQVERKDEIARLLKRAFGVRNDLAKRIERLVQVVGQNSALSSGKFPERPPSVDLQKVAYFWGEAFAGRDREAGGVVSTSKVRWATLFGVIFEVAFAAFYYFGFLNRRQH